jgi:putative peptidoglycan lipid II flippase
MTSETVPVSTPAPAVEASATLTTEETHAGVARATGVVALGNITSRVLGLAREIVLTNLFGASRAVDAFNVAIIVPRAIYDLLIGGHVNSALVPVLSEVAVKEGRKALWELVSILCTLVTIILAVMVLLLYSFAPQVVRLVSSGFDPLTLSLAEAQLRLTAPALLFMGLFAVLSGTLYALKEFTWPAFAVTVFNGSVVVVGLLLAPSLRLVPHLAPNGMLELIYTRPDSGIIAVTLGWLIGSVAQLLLQFPGMKGARLRPRFNWRHPSVQRVAGLYAPVMFSLIIDALVIRTFSYNLASQTGEGSIGYMNWATTLIQFPQGLVATAISIAILPTLSRQSAVIASEGERPFKDTLGLGLRLAITLILPAAVGLYVMATPIVALLFQHGAFNANDTAITSQALRFYLLGLPFAAVDLLLIYAFYARQDTLTPALVGVFSLVIYMATAILLFPRYGLFSLMIADSVKHIVHAATSFVLLMHRLKGMGGQRLTATLLKTGLAAGVMGAVVWAIIPSLTRWIGTRTLMQEVLLVGLVGAVSVLVYVGLALLLRVGELRWMGGLLLRRLRG